MFTTTTAIAAFHIGGITLHSVLHLPVQKHNCNDLRAPALTKLQHKLKDTKYITVDEVSMLGQNMMSWIDKRLRQATTHLDIPSVAYHIAGNLANWLSVVIGEI